MTKRFYMADEPEITPIADPLAEGIVVGFNENDKPKKDEAPKE